MTESKDTLTAAAGEPTPGPNDGVRTFLPRQGGARHAQQVNVSEVRVWARELGLADVGAARVDAATLTGEEQARALTQKWVEAEHHAGLAYMQTPRLSAQQLLPTVKTVLVALAATEHVTSRSHEAPPHDVASKRTTTTGNIAAYARGLDYHSVVRQKLWALTQHLSDALAIPVTVRVCVDTAPLLERYWASAAGVAFVGKSTMAIAPGIGSRVVLGVALLDCALAASPPLLDGCGTCTRCLDACPTQAFAAPYVLDAGKCISYLTIENPKSIEPTLREAVGDHVFGCDVCQTVCPYNASRKLPAALFELRSTPERREASLTKWLELTSSDYRRLTQKSALRRTPRAQLQRNAAIALGNSQHPDAIPQLEKALHHNPSPLVREHAAWALGQMGHARSAHVRLILRAALERESDPAVRAQLEQASSRLEAQAEDRSG